MAETYEEHIQRVLAAGGAHECASDCPLPAMTEDRVPHRHPHTWSTRDYSDPMKPAICGKCGESLHVPTPKDPAAMTSEDRGGIPCRFCSKRLRSAGADASGLVKWEHRGDD